MAISPIMYNATVQRTQDYTTMKQNEDNKGMVDQSNFMNKMEKEVKLQLSNVRSADNAEKKSDMMNKIPIRTITINGTNGEWVEHSIELESFVAIDYYLDLAFAQSGIQIGEIKAVRDRDVYKPHLSIE